MVNPAVTREGRGVQELTLSRGFGNMGGLGAYKKYLVDGRMAGRMRRLHFHVLISAVLFQDGERTSRAIRQRSIPLYFRFLRRGKT